MNNGIYLFGCCIAASVGISEIFGPKAAAGVLIAVSLIGIGAALERWREKGRTP